MSHHWLSGPGPIQVQKSAGSSIPQSDFVFYMSSFWFLSLYSPNALLGYLLLGTRKVKTETMFASEAVCIDDPGLQFPHYPLLQWLYGGRLVALKVSWQK